MNDINLAAFGGQQRPPQQEGHGFGATMGAATRQANDMYNLWEMLDRESFEPDPDFQLLEAAKTSDIWDRHSDVLASAQSLPEFQQMEARLRQRDEDLSLLADQGFGGFAASMAMGLVSPTVFIPFIGQARGVKGVAQSFGLAAAAATAQEAPLIANQLGRTDMENFTGIAAGTVLGGLMGSTAVMLRRSDFDRMARDLDPLVEPAAAATLRRAEDGRIVRDGQTSPLRFPEEIGAGPLQRTRVPEFRSDLLARAEGADVPPPRVEGDAALPARPVSPTRQRPAFEGVPTRELEEFVEIERAQLAKIEDDYARVTQEIEEMRGAAGDNWDDAVPPELEELARRRVELEEAREQVQEVLAKTDQEFDYRKQTGDDGRAPEEPEVGTSGPVVGREATPAGGAMGAMQTGTRFDPELGPVGDAGTIANAAGVGEVLAFTAPLARNVQQAGWPIKSSVVRDLSQRLSDSGLVMQGNRRGIVTAPGGTVEHRLGHYRGILANALEIQYEAYLRYLKNGEAPALGDRLRTVGNNALNRAPTGKMTYLQFKEAVMDASNNPDAPVAREALEVARKWKKEFFGSFNEEMLAATAARGDDPLYDIRENYFMQALSPDLVAQNRTKFVEDYAEAIMIGATDLYARRIAKLHQQMEQVEGAEALLSSNKQEAEHLLTQFQEQLGRHTDPAELDPRVDQIRALRDEAKEMFETRLEKELELKPADMLEDQDYIRGLRAQVRRDIAEQVQELRDRADALEAELPSAVIESKDARSKIRKQMALIRKSFGATEAKREQLLKRVESNEELSTRAMERVVNASKRFLAAAARWDEKKLATEYERLVALSRKNADIAERGMGRVYKLEGAEEGQKLSLERARQAGREQRADRASERAQAALGRTVDREEMIADIRARLDESIKNVQRVNDKRAVRNAQLMEQAEEMTPERVQAQLSSLRSGLQRRVDALEDSLTKDKATGINVRRGEFSFQEMAKDAAEDLANKIVGNFTKIGVMDALTDMRGPMKQRILKMDYEKKKRYMEKDTEKALARYTQQMSADIELYSAYGDVNAKGALQAIIDDMTNIRKKLETRTVDEKGKPITEAQRQKELLAHEKHQMQAYNAFAESLDRIRGLRGMPSHPSHIGYRLGRLFQHWNVATLMGSAAVTSIPDLGRTVMAYGLTHTLRTSWVPFVRGLIDPAQKQMNAQAIRQLKLMGIGVDTFTQHRSKGYMDMMANSPFQSRGERAMESLSMATPMVALFGQWTDGMKLLSGSATMARIIGAVDDLANGKAKAADVEFLASLNIDESAARGIWHQLNTPNGGTKHQDIILPNLESWDDRQLRRLFEQAVTRESDRLVITPGLERPLWMDANPLYRLVAQFRSFTMAANTKMTVAALQTRDMALYHTMQGVVTSLALGTLSYYIWAHTVGGNAVTEMQNAGWETWVDQALYRSGLLGALSEVQSFATTIPAVRDFANFEGAASAGRRPDSIIGALAGPTFGKAQTMASFLAGIDDPTEGTVRQARKMIPYQNVFYLRQGFNWMEQGVADYFNLPDRRS